MNKEELKELLKRDMEYFMNDVKHWERRIHLTTDNSIYENSRRSWIRSKTISLSKWEYARKILNILESEAENEK